MPLNTKILPDIFVEKELEDVITMLNPSEPVAFDTETIGKYGKIRLAQFYQKHWKTAVLVEYPDPFVLFQMFSTRPDMTVLMQYSIYDISTIQAQIGGPFIPPNFEDTFLLARLGFPHLSEYSLDALIRYVLDYDPYKEANIDKKAMHKENWSRPVLTFEQKYYSAIDVFYLFHLYDKIESQRESLSYKLDKFALLSALSFQRNGLAVDKDRLYAQYSSNMDEIREINLPINCNSYQQVRPYIGSNESDDIGLAKLAMEGNEKAAAVRRARKLTKQNSFLNKFDTDNGYIYGHFAPTARSGRFTCNDQNLQQLPRATKGVFGYPEDFGRVFVYSDYPQLELRGAAAVTADEVMVAAFKAHEDLHDKTAAFIFGDFFTKDERRIAKTANFNLLYGGGAGMFQKILIKEANVLLSIDEIKVIIRKWKRLYKRVAQWQQKGIRDYQRGSLGSTPFGRKYKANMMTDQLNLEMQGFGAEVAKLAMHYMTPKLKDFAESCTELCDELGQDLEPNSIANFIHDAFILDVPNHPGIYEPIAEICSDAMGNAWREATKMVAVKDMPMPVQVAVGYNWGDIEDDDTPNLFDFQKIY